GKDMTAANRLDRAQLAAGIARQPRVGRRVDVAGAYPLALLEAGWAGRRALEASRARRVRILDGHLPVEPNPRPQRPPGGDPILADQAMRDDPPLQPQEPAFVIGG